MRRFQQPVKPRPILTVGMPNWIRGLNTLVSNTQINRVELSEATDIQLVEDGKVQVPRTGQQYFGPTEGTKITGIFPFYRSDGTRKVLRMNATKLEEYNPSGGTWDDVTGSTYTTTLDTSAVTAYDYLFICNGTDALTRYDGSSITAFSEISAPSAPTATRTGTTGSYTYSYKVTAVTAVGETTPSPAGSTNLNVATLDSSNYVTVSWSTVTNAIGYNLYGRRDGSWKFMLYIEGNASTSYVDKGTLTPQDFFSPPEGNTTGGPKGKYVDVYKDTLFITGDPDNPSRVYYSGGGDKINDFTVGNGGGFIDVSKNDGQVSTGLKLFRNFLLIFKEDSIYQFSFGTDGLPSITQVSPSVGAISGRSIVSVENDVMFASRRGIFAVGNESGFGFDVLRTNELSARVRPIYQSIETSRLQNISAVYATKDNSNLVIFSYTPTGGSTNSEALVYDRERLAWYKWTNISANCWANYIDSEGETHVLYGCETSGYVKEILSGNDDFGSSIPATVKFRAEDFGKANVYKRLKDIDLILREPTGTVTMNLIIDGTTTAISVPITSVTPTINWGHYLFKDFLFGESIGSGVSTQDENVIKTLKNVNQQGRTFMIELSNSSGSFVLLFLGLSAKLKSERYRQSEDLIQL